MHGLLLIAMQLEGRNKEENGNSVVYFSITIYIPLSMVLKTN